MSTKVTMRDMLEAGVHFGHQTHRWNPKMKPFIFGARNGIYIINLQKTYPLFVQAVNFARQVVTNGSQILFLGTKRQAQEVLEEQARRSKMPYVTYRWLGGMLTNYVTIRQSLEKIDVIDLKLAEGSVEKLKKKEVLKLEKLREKLLKNLGGIKGMKGVPGAIFVVDPNRERIAVAEARKLKIPVIAMIDTNGDPETVDYPIPSNDDAIRAIKLFATAIADASIEGAEANKLNHLAATDKQSASKAGADSQVEVIVKRKRPEPEQKTEQEAAPVAPVAPEAVAPVAVTPEAVAPEAVAPEAVTPEAVAPVAVTPEAVAPVAVTPETKDKNGNE
jgi:small subunit ribosomal protein S2